MTAGGAAPTYPSAQGAAPARIANEADYYPTVIDAARIVGWKVAHFRPARVKGGWRTAVQGDGKGFPDFVLVHAGAHRVWFVELKLDKAHLTADQRLWGETLIRAGAVYRTVYVPSGIDQFVQDLADTVNPT